MDEPPIEPAALNRQPSPVRLLCWKIGLLFAIVNLAMLPCFATLIGMSLGRAFAKGPRDPWDDFWITTLGWISLLLISCLPVQAALVTVGFTWGPGNYWRRFVEHWLVVLPIVGTYLGGFLLMFVPPFIHAWSDPNVTFTLDWGDPEQRGQELLGFVAVLCSLPILLLAVQLPFWLARHFFGCRLVNEDEPREKVVRSDSLALRDLFVATALVATSLGLLQFSDRVNVSQGHAEQAYLFTMLIVAACCCGISLIAGLPLAVMWLNVRNLWLAWGIMLAGEGIVLLICNIISTCFWPAWGGITGLVVAVYVYSIGTAVGFTILRRNGWRLATRWSDAHV